MAFVEVQPSIYSVGVPDPACREFHIHTIGRGTSYNSYLIKDGANITIVDTVKNDFQGDYLNNIKAALVGKQGNVDDDSVFDKVTVLFCLHTERDHGGSYRELHSKCKNAELFCSKSVRANLLRFYPESKDWKIREIKNQEKVTVGSLTFILIETPLLHWNDSSMLYIPEKKALFSSDAFGQHVGNNIKIPVGASEDDVLVQMKVYYAQVFSQIVRPTLKMVSDVQLVSTGQAPPKAAKEEDEWKTDVNISGVGAILPSHGMILNTPSLIKKSFLLYKRWALQIPERKIIILTESIYKVTSTMGKLIADGAEQETNTSNTGVRIENLGARHTSVLDIVHEVLDAPVVLIGTGTFNNALYPDLEKVLYILHSYNFKPKFVGVFGSYGWSPLAIKELEDFALTKLKWVPLQTGASPITVVNEIEGDVAATKNLLALGALAAKKAAEIGVYGNCLTTGV